MSEEKRIEDKQYEKLKLKYKKELKKYNEIQRKINELKKQQPKLYDIENRLMQLSHKYVVGDYVVLKTKEIARIEKLIRRKHYKVFVACLGLKGGLGTKQRIHEDEILCHVMDLELSIIRYKKHGLRKENEV